MVSVGYLTAESVFKQALTGKVCLKVGLSRPPFPLAWEQGLMSNLYTVVLCNLKQRIIVHFDFRRPEGKAKPRHAGGPVATVEAQVPDVSSL